MLSKEDKIIQKATDFMLDIHSQDNETIKEEYIKLLTHYEKLSKSLKSTLRNGDNLQRHILDSNESLEHNVKTIKQLSREQVMNQVSKNSELKQLHSHDLSQHQHKIKDIIEQSKIEKILLENQYIKKIKKLEKEKEELKKFKQSS